MSHVLDCKCLICKSFVEKIENKIEQEKTIQVNSFIPVENLLKCSFCGKERDIVAGVPDFANSDDFGRYCKSCFQKSVTFKYKYRLTLEQYRSILTDQKGRCAICDVLLAEGGLGSDSPTVDHCHESGHVRGILCTRCNKGLGQFKDSIANLKIAIVYLLKNQIKRIWWYQR